MPIKSYSGKTFGGSARPPLGIRRVKPDSPQYVDHPVDHYRDLYVGVGKLRDCKVKLHVDKTVEPVVQRQRRIPFHIRKKVEAELDHLEEEDIIEK